jgi:hypothetical protein
MSKNNIVNNREKDLQEMYPEYTTEQNSDLSDLLCLKLRNAIADKEWCIAAANHDTVKYGSWQCDWYGEMRDADKRIQELITKVEA